jgi:hypothetical protein
VEAIQKQRVTTTDNIILDFTGLFSQSKAPKTPAESISQQEEYRNTIETENHEKRLLEDLQGVSILQRQAELNKAEKEKALEVYRKYQENTKISSQLQTEILQGARRGENTDSLFLKACKAISLMTSDSVFYSQLEDIYAKKTL